jgi:hypothetical protein
MKTNQPNEDDMKNKNSMQDEVVTEDAGQDDASLVDCGCEPGMCMLEDDEVAVSEDELSDFEEALEAFFSFNKLQAENQELAEMEADLEDRSQALHIISAQHGRILELFASSMAAHSALVLKAVADLES